MSSLILQSTNNKIGGVKFAEKPLKHMNDSNRYVDPEIIKKALKTKAYKDPKGSRAKMYYMTITKYHKKSEKFKKYNFEVLYDKKTKTVWHFKYTSKKLGPLQKPKN